jgi:hypothetical protein
MRTQHRVNSYLNFYHTAKHKLATYLQGLG